MLLLVIILAGAPWFMQTRLTTEGSILLLRQQKCLAEQTGFKTISIYLRQYIESTSAGAKQKMHICYQMNCTYR